MRVVNVHRAELNDQVRAIRQGRGELQGEQLYQTTEGERAFAAGDRVLSRENNRDLGVKNGMLGTVERAGWRCAWIPPRVRSRPRGFRIDG